MKRIRLVYHIAFLLILALAGFFYYLRVPYNRSALEFFQLLNDNGYWYSRDFWLHLPALLPSVIAMKLGASLKVLMIVYSMSYPFVLYLITIILTYFLKDKYGGAFLLLLQLGVHESFYVAKQDMLYVLSLLYLFYAIINYFLNKKHLKDCLPIQIICALFLLVLSVAQIRQLPFEHIDAIGSNYYYESGLQYMKSQLLSVYLIIGLIGAYLGLFFVTKKQIKPLLLLLSFVVIFMGMFYNKPGYGIDMELRLLPLVFLVLLLFKIYILENIESLKISAGILTVLMILVVFGPLYASEGYEKRNENILVLLSASEDLEQDKIAIKDNLQVQDRYINPEYLPIETVLIASLHNKPPKSLFFFPDEYEIYEKADFIFSHKKYFENYSLNPVYFNLKDDYYHHQKEKLIKLKVITDAFCGAENTLGKTGLYGLFQSEPDSAYVFSNTLSRQSSEVYEGKYAVHTLKGLPYSMTIFFEKLERGDSLELSVYRKGSNNGHLVLSDNKAKAEFYVLEQTISEPDENGWQRLSSSAIIPKGLRSVRAYVYNVSDSTDLVYFDNFRIRIWREKFEKE